MKLYMIAISLAAAVFCSSCLWILLGGVAGYEIHKHDVHVVADQGKK